jgi:hypothetical protein
MDIVKHGIEIKQQERSKHYQSKGPHTSITEHSNNMYKEYKLLGCDAV